ncbi:MAG: hypothetical protein ABI175_06885 [Polyangiales bacterium]
MRAHGLGLGAVIGLVVVSGLVTRSAQAQGEAKSSRVESDPVMYKAGDRVMLPMISASIELPASPGGWAVYTAKETSNSWDVVKRMEPGLPGLTFDFTRPSLKCADAAALFDKLASVMKRMDNPAFVPGTFEGWAYELPAGDDGLTTLKVCTNTKQGPVMASVIYEGPASGIDPSRVKPILEAVGQAVNGHRSVGAGPSGSVATALTPLSVTGITISLPATWAASVEGKTAEERTDVLERKFPASPTLILLLRRGNNCNLGQAPGHFVESPVYLPDGWGGRAVEDFDPKDNTSGSFFCNRTKDGDWIVGTVIYIGSLGSPDMMEVKPILATIISQVGAAPTASSSSSTGDSGDSDSSYDRGGSGNDLYSLLELGIAQYDPAFPEAEKTLGGILGINAFGITNDYGKTVGGAWKVSTQIGYGKDSWIPFDAQVGLGLGLQFGRIALAPLVGIGVDGAGGSASDGTNLTVSKIKPGGYWYVGLEGKISASSIGIALGFELVRRKADGNTIEDALDKETRVTMRIILKGWSIGVQYLGYGTSVDPKPDSLPKIIQGMVGFHL